MDHPNFWHIHLFCSFCMLKGGGLWCHLCCENQLIVCGAGPGGWYPSRSPIYSLSLEMGADVLRQNWAVPSINMLHGKWTRQSMVVMSHSHLHFDVNSADPVSALKCMEARLYFNVKLAEIIIPPQHGVGWGVYWFQLVRLSVRLSVRL